ncbi:wax ester/triacylglycerol synthase family O-acyltransferase [Ferrimonas sediminicola]|uniref:diacylglycerol O-acyltransferase n=1 Tax=Ferrimonas sediminicola TaxID=2569538 RepID=A0A4U1B9C4_9GAMM|nr:wax ester/triacylglycerol synthase family O-acyltransferase [Ferrimonas sediminicola]TKB47350.1 wax ester/triacylglycerol synthase family O-acyltransferase [Ferrimonas sediminicola]
MSKMNLMDSLFFLVESNQTPMHVTPMMVIRPDDQHKPDFALRLYQTLLGKQPVESPFNWRPRLSLTGNPRWEAVPVELDYHVRLSAVPAPGRRAQLNELLCRLQSQPLDRSRPLWELYIIDGMSDGTVVLFMKLHHALFDGVGLNRYAKAMLTRTPDHHDWTPIWQHPAPDRKSMAAPGFVKSAVAALSGAAGQSKLLPEAMRLGARLCGRALGVRHGVTRVPFTAPRSLFNRTPASGRSFASLTVPLKRIKEIGARAGASFNDVILTACDMALNRYLEERRITLDKPLVVMMPMSVRESGQLNANNQFVFGLVELSRGQLMPLQRLNRIRRAAMTTKNEIRHFSAELYQKYGVAIQALSLLAGRVGLERKVPASSNLVISTVPGPQEPRYIMGARVLEVSPMSALPPGQSLNITSYSFDGKVCLGFLGCRKVLPDIGMLATYLERALDELELAVLTQPMSLFDLYRPDLNGAVPGPKTQSPAAIEPVRNRAG